MKPKQIDKLFYLSCVTVAGYFAARNMLFFLSASPQLYRLADFNHYYSSAALLLSGKDPYTSVFRSLEFDFLWHPQIQHGTNPPLLIVFFIPFLALGARIAWVFWECILLVSSIGILWKTRSIVSLTTARDISLLSTLMFFGSLPMVNSMLYAQIQPLLLLLVLIGAGSLLQGRSSLAGACWGAATALKLFPWPLLLFLYLARQFKAAAVGSIVFVGLTLISAHFGEVDLLASFFRSAVPVISEWAISSTENLSIALDLSSALRVNGNLLPAISIAISTVGILFSLRLYRKHRLSGLCFAICISFLAAPVAWPSYLIVFILPFYVIAGTGSSVHKVIVFSLWQMILVLPNQGTLPHGLVLKDIIILPNPISIPLTPNAFELEASRRAIEIVPLVLLMVTYWLLSASIGHNKLSTKSTADSR